MLLISADIELEELLHAYVVDFAVEASEKIPSMKSVLFLGVFYLCVWPFRRNLTLFKTNYMFSNSLARSS